MCVQDCKLFVETLIDKYTELEDWLIQRRIMSYVRLSESFGGIKKDCISTAYLVTFAHELVCSNLNEECTRVRATRRYLAVQVIDRVETAIRSLLTSGCIKEISSDTGNTHMLQTTYIED